jgi:hypothetical protein
MGPIDNLLHIDREYLYVIMTGETPATDAFMELIVSHIIFGGSMQNRVGECCSFPRQEGGQNLEPHVLLIPIAMGAPLNYANLVIQALDEAELGAARSMWGDRTGLGARMGRDGPIAVCRWRSARTETRRRTSSAVSTEFARPRGGCTIQPHGNRRRLEPHLQLCVNHGAFFEAHLRIDISLITFSAKNIAL